MRLLSNPFQTLEGETRDFLRENHDPNASRRLMASSAICLGVLGKGSTHLSGAENLLPLVKNPDEGFVIGVSHVTDVDVHLAFVLTRLIRPNAFVATASYNFNDPVISSLSHIFIGKDNLVPVKWNSHNGPDNRPHPFSGEHYATTAKRVGEGGAFVSAAYSPQKSSSQPPFAPKPGGLTCKPGKLVPHVALQADKSIIPVSVRSNGQAANPSRLTPYKISDFLVSKDFIISVGAPIRPDASDIDRYRELSKVHTPDSVQERGHLLNQLGNTIVGAIDTLYFSNEIG